MKTDEAKRLKNIFAVYRALPPHEAKSMDVRVRRIAEGIVEHHQKDDRPSLVGVFEAEVAKVRARIFEEEMLRSYASRIQLEVEEGTDVAKDPSFPGWPGFKRPETRLSGPVPEATQLGLAPSLLAEALPPRFGGGFIADPDEWNQDRE